MIRQTIAKKPGYVLSQTQLVSAIPAEIKTMNEAYAVVERWEQAFNKGDAGAIAALYAPGATIWGTLTQTLTTSPQAIESYFAEAARAGLRVRLGEHVSSQIS